MKGLAIASALVLGAALLPAGPAQAKGCMKGAVVGGTAGHFAGHHGVLGAMAGCAVGHHQAEKHARDTETDTQAGYGSSTVAAADSGAAVGFPGRSEPGDFPSCGRSRLRGPGNPLS